MNETHITLNTYHRPTRGMVKLSGIVRVSAEAEIAVRELADATGMSMRDVASSLLVQAASLCELVPHEVQLKEVKKK